VNSNSVAVDPVGQFLFIPRADGQIIVCSILSDGALTPVPGSPFASGNTPAVAVNPSGTFLFAPNAERLAHSIWVYNLASTGVLTPVKPHIRTENYPQTLVVDPSGKFLYVANLSNSITGYRIDLQQHERVTYCISCETRKSEPQLRFHREKACDGSGS